MLSGAEQREVVLATVAEMEESSSGPQAEAGSRRSHRRLPDISSLATTGPANTGGGGGGSQSSRSFDSGICVLLSDSGSPSPPLHAGSDTRDTADICGEGARALLATSPVPPRSPITPSKRASFHAYSPAKLPRPPVPPNSPCFKNSKPSFFANTRRFSEQSGGKSCSDPAAPRTLSPASVSPVSSGAHKSPSPSFSSVSSKSPQLPRSLGSVSASLQSAESEESPPKSPDCVSPAPAPAPAPAVSSSGPASRRKLPETPTKKVSATTGSSGSGLNMSLHSGACSRATTQLFTRLFDPLI